MSYAKITDKLKKGDRVLLAFECLKDNSTLSAGTLNSKFRYLPGAPLPEDGSAKIAELTAAVEKERKQVDILVFQAHQNGDVVKGLENTIAQLKKKLENPSTAPVLAPPQLVSTNATTNSLTLARVPGADKLSDYGVKTT